MPTGNRPFPPIVPPMSAPPTVLISSLGLMGGSLAAALSAAGWQVWLHHRRSEVAARAEELGFGRQAPDPLAVLPGCDVAVVCTPVAVIAETVRRFAAAGGSAVITDVGSTKGGICADLADLARSGRFIGSHPMAGSHLQGLEHARSDLYQGALTLITPLPETPEGATARVESLWTAVGSRVRRMDPLAHDQAVVAASHLPHVLASTAAAQLDAAALPLAATGFRDTTRVAGGSPELWSEILIANRDAVRLGMTAARTHLAALDAALERGDVAAVRAWLEHGHAGRQRFEQAGARTTRDGQ